MAEKFDGALKQENRSHLSIYKGNLNQTYSHKEEFHIESYLLFQYEPQI